MSKTGIADVSNQVQKKWSPIFMDELKENTLLPGLTNKDYEGEIKGMGGDTVRVSQINRPDADLLTIGTDADTFNTTKLTTSYVDIQVNKRIVAAYEFEDLAVILSQLDQQNSKIRQGLLEACEIKLNDYLYGLISPSTSSPDHLVSGVADFNGTELNKVRKLAAQAKWAKGEIYGLLDPQYYSDLLNSQTIVSKDYVDETPVIAGQIVNKRFGFNLLEDNSAGLVAAMQRLDGSSTEIEDCGLFFHRDFLHLVMGEPTIEVVSLKPNKQFGFMVVADFWCGAKIGIDGNKKHVFVYNT